MVLPIGAITGWLCGPRLLRLEAFQAAMDAACTATAVSAVVYVGCMVALFVAAAIGGAAPLTWESVSLAVIFIGLVVVVGSLVSLFVTIPCGFAWALIARRLMAR